MRGREQALQLLVERFGPGGDTWTVTVPGRVNLIGEHIDYHGLAVMPMALGRGLQVAFRVRDDARVRAASGNGYGEREFEWLPRLNQETPGDWVNYLKAAAQAVGDKWGRGRGLDAAVVSDLPAAAGLSSSSALLIAFTLGLLRANGHPAEFEELMGVLPEGEYFVGTRGGGMDHAACLGSKPGCASLIEFQPLSLVAVPVPRDWTFLVAHCLKHAEKSAGVREEYNARRTAGTAALAKLGFRSYAEAIAGSSFDELCGIAARRLAPVAERDAFIHVTGEALRVREALPAMERGDGSRFGQLLAGSHVSLRDRLRVSCEQLDRLVDAAMESGALGARLTGAGFGGCVVALCERSNVEQVRAGLKSSYYAGREEFREEMHLITAQAGAGALEQAG